MQITLEEEQVSYNDNYTQYNTAYSTYKRPRYEEIQVRFNNILQKRDQLEENLTGSQITYLLDHYIERGFDLLLFIKHEQELLDKMQAAYHKTVSLLLKNRRKLFSIRFTNEEIYDILVNLFFETSIQTFIRKFLSIKLNREIYLEFLDLVLKDEPLVSEHYKFYRAQYTELKNLLLGNYIRYAFSETNKFFTYYKDRMSIEAKEDYFSGLMLVILKVIDKYDSFKGTLTSFIENWLKDYRTTFRTRQTLVIKACDIENETHLEGCSLEEEFHEAALERSLTIEAKILDHILASTGGNFETLKALVCRHSKQLPLLKTLLYGACHKASNLN